MRWCYCVTLFFCIINGNCEIDVKSSSDNVYEDVLKQNAEGINTTTCFIQAKSRENLVESKSVKNTFLKGKECLRSFKECIDKDTTYQATASNLISYLVNTAAPISLNGLQGVSEECQKSHQIFIEDLYNFKYWALQMYDATAKLPSGLLHGNVLQFGDFDLCMKSSNPVHKIYGQYCLANIQIEVPSSAYLAAIYNLIHSHGIIRSKLSDSGHRVPRFSSIQWAVCVPDTCTPKDVDIGIKEVLKHIFNGTGIQYNTLVDSTLCSSAKEETWPVTTTVACLLLLLIILFEVFATFYDTYWKNNNNVILAFSMRNNVLKLCSLKSNDNVEAIHLVRFMNGLMLLVAHKSMAVMFLPYINRTPAAEHLGASWTVLARAASLYTDPFIMISGTLTAYSLIGKLNSSKRINIIEEYASRVLRILPTLVVLIVFCTLVLPWINSGPLWKSVVTHHSDICKSNWWKNVLFIHNYFGFENMCLTHTHHVGIDMQLFFISPLLTLLIWKWPKRGLIGLCTLAIVSTGMRYHSTYIRNLANYVYYGASSEQLFLTADYMYIIPAYRLTVYVMGIILGYLLRQHKDIRFKQIYIHIGNVIALLSFVGAFMVPSFMGNYNYEYDPVEAAWYAAYAPILWCLCFAWIIYITHIGHIGYIAPILRNPIPKMWSKISYTVYLTQFPVYFYNVGTTKHPDEFGVIRKHLNFLEFFWVIACSVVLTLLIELPSQNIRDCIFKKPKPSHNQIQKKNKLI